MPSGNDVAKLPQLTRGKFVGRHRDNLVYCSGRSITMKISGCILAVLLHVFQIYGSNMERKPHPCPIIPRSDGHRPGHLEQLGCQRPPLGPVKEYFEPPTPRELYENHVNPYIPAVIRNALKGSPALTKWTEDEYLINSYGDQEVLVEKKYEDRKSEPKRMQIKEFLQNYRDQNWYVVTILPNAMRRDLRVPTPLVCSSFNKNLAELNLWIGTRGTRSLLHHDADNIMHCVVTGLKDWILIDRAYRDKMDMVIGRDGQGSGFSHLDVDKINEDVNPEVWDVPWQYVTLRGGDCLYLPHKYLHQVRSYNRTVSATLLWYPEGEFTDDDCQGVDYNAYMNLTDAYVHWTYEKGQETVDMGYMNPARAKNEIAQLFDVLGIDKMDMDYYMIVSLLQLGESVEENFSKVLDYFKIFDNNNDGFITKDEFHEVAMEDLKEYCRIGDSPHGPTKTMMSESDKFSARVPEFGPRSYQQRFLDGIWAKVFLQFVLRVKGTEGQLTYPVFKENIQVRDGHIADAFILFDRNFDGVITTEELNSTVAKRFRDFSKMRYNLEGTRITGGGKYESELIEGNMFFLRKLNHIPEKYIITEEDRQAEEDESAEFFETVAELREAASNGMDKKSFRKFTSEEENERFHFDSFGSDVVFAVMDRNRDGVLTVDDLDQFQSYNTDIGKRERYGPTEIIGSLHDQLRKLKQLRPAIEEFKRENSVKKSNNAEKPQKTEL